MTILFGHPGGNPNSHNAALAHFEAGWLEAFCVPWMPSQMALECLGLIPGLSSRVGRLSRRHFAPLGGAPLIQGRLGEFRRLLIRALGAGDEALSYQANDWLMATMRRQCRRNAVHAVHAYEDCSLLQFEEAKKLDKACIYDMPIGYYESWQKTQAELEEKYSDWLPDSKVSSSRHVRPDQKRKEMALADLVLAPSSFVRRTIGEFYPKKQVAIAPYGVNLDFWAPSGQTVPREHLRFIFAGQMSLRKGIPLLLEAWKSAALQNAELILIGSWYLAEEKRRSLPANVVWRPPCSAEELRDHLRSADIFVFSSHFEGLALILLEAMACGLPAIASDATGGADVLTNDCGRVVPANEPEALIAGLLWFSENRNLLPRMGHAARLRAGHFTWENYRRSVAHATGAFA